MSGRTTFLEWEPTTLSAPSAGKAALSIDPKNHLSTLDSSGNIWVPGLQASSLADVAMDANTGTNTALATISVSSGMFHVGASIRGTVAGTFTAAAPGVAAAYLIALQVGDATTLSNSLPVIAQFSPSISWATAAAVPFSITLITTLTAIGASATVGAGMVVTRSQGTSGIVTGVVSITDTGLAVAFDSTTAKRLVMSASDGISRSYTVTSATVELLPA